MKKERGKGELRTIRKREMRREEKLKRENKTKV